ncbi:unnamed protein product [Discosporangium mesarthrocarpum]
MRARDRGTSMAYPQTTQRSYVKWMLFGSIGMFVMFWLSSSTGGGGNSSTNMGIRGSRKKVMLSELLGVGLVLTAQAAHEIKEVKRLDVEDVHIKGQTKEGADELITNADERSNKVFINGYRNQFPGIDMLSEETEPEKDGTLSDMSNFRVKLKHDQELDISEIRVIVDPLDATQEFTENLQEYVTTMVCIVKNGKPIAGIINQVFEDSPPIWGVVGKDGAEGETTGRSYVSGAVPGNSKVTLSRSHTGGGGSVIEKYLNEKEVIMAGGAGYKSLLVVDGVAEAYLHVTHIKSWDVCAAEAVVKAIGGVFTDVDGSSLDYSTNNLFTRGIIATRTQNVHDEYIGRLAGRLD